MLVSIVIGAAEVIAATGTNQLAAMAGKAAGAGGAKLAVVVDGLRVL
jgi:NaMN:DMB phosphoribosyltransferase